MKKLTALLTAAILAATCTTGCGKLSKAKLDSWQIELLEAEGLSTEYSELTAEQKHFIDRVGKMINYLNKKYDAEFVYYDYEPPELLNSEKLYAYPKSTGMGNGKYLVTVKARNGGFEDDFHDFSVAKLAEDMVNEFLLTQFKEGEFKLIHQTYACDIKMSEIENGDFKWEYGGFWGLFIDEKVCDMEHVEEFAVKYAKWLNEHRIDGSHRIEILHEFPKEEKVWKNYGDIYGNSHGESAGFFCMLFRIRGGEATGVSVDGVIYENAKKIKERFDYECTLDEFFS